MTINCNGKLLSLDSPRVMGILNITPDSFSDGGRFNQLDVALRHTEEMLEQGASIIDIGGQSTRPDSTFLDAETELQRILPVIEKLVENFPDIIISVDTFWAKVAKASIQAGASIVNDISGGAIDDKMFETVAQLKVPYILMHMRGTPQTMTQNTEYDNIFEEVQLYFSQKIFELKKLGINDIILDPGYGFSKTLHQNYELLRQQKDLLFGKYPILTGISRKSMIYKLLDTPVQESQNGTTALNMLALENNAKILRVHDVKAAVECVKIWETYHS
ncbi:dihydropteroate synthase [Ornithobacterium rhinotracheale]|uniref:Dihydropteroate synthase n=1 Tax=Ornithobacterium rhinotracheale (strain ATCC 51463 / DSM 15997 / CCUG 23171 / CIP 104009 / LMG 9086) TaxID=867902 RepID=I4A2Q4_ORNRL|nr:dihydropteroate synthase [Ornithobacterium rhinotracheale]AFL98238.1 dihydropteroate synthase [Ornithobacterium rhinotracheale DSM 15997]AIP99982.1 dihydropteroate synthase [Ornithobacterium rhinotracheale ORT-UMN 88]KGB66137.1 dihydropteroate synthase [Ornithobacterium rhinotracheale H06-030791]MBN3662680.1 dihydropteroate synthase [Ornithobacterium rhinotracheale]MCK0193461.1 dihydropteroate synthase [Ornithobacterium rhinotracheale]